MRIERNWGFPLVNNVILTSLCLLMLMPYAKILAEAFSSAEAVDAGRVLFLPVDFTLNNFRLVLQNESLIRSYGVTLFVTIVGTTINLLFTSLYAYPLSRPHVRHKRFFLIVVTMTMIFPAPLIPRYLVVRALGLLDTVWGIMIPAAISGFNFFIMRTFFLQMPNELFESAEIDGAGELLILRRIVLPLSKPVMASMGLFYAIYHWNSYFMPLMFIRNTRLYTLQVRLRLLLHSVNNQFEDTVSDIDVFLSPQAIQMATIIVVVAPILLLYPFLQKYFTKGVMLGSLKG